MRRLQIVRVRPRGERLDERLDASARGQYLPEELQPGHVLVHGLPVILVRYPVVPVLIHLHHHKRHKVGVVLLRVLQLAELLAVPVGHQQHVVPADVCGHPEHFQVHIEAELDDVCELSCDGQRVQK